MSYRKKYIEEIKWGTSLLFDCTPSFLCHFLLLSLSTPPSQVMHLLNDPYKDTQYCYEWYSAWWYHEWTVEKMKISCNLTLAGCYV